MMRLQDFMSQDVETITSGETVAEAYRKMQQKSIRHLVVMENNTIVGVLSERDLGGMSDREQEGCLVESIMQAQVVTAKPETTIREAANLMRGRTVGCLPVASKHKLVGIVTTTDLLDLLGQGIERLTPDTPKRPITRENPSKKQPSFNPQLR